MSTRWWVNLWRFVRPSFSKPRWLDDNGGRGDLPAFAFIAIFVFILGVGRALDQDFMSPPPAYPASTVQSGNSLQGGIYPMLPPGQK